MGCKWEQGCLLSLYGVCVGEREEVIEEYMQTHAHSALTLFC